LGGSHVFLPAFDPVAIMAAIAEHQVTDVLLVPTMIQMIVDHPEVGAYDLSCPQNLTYGASPISEALLLRARKVFSSAAFTQAYGDSITGCPLAPSFFVASTFRLSGSCCRSPRCGAGATPRSD
jgi:acyl-CoA synthetase (AMP-forming)/AMP-acid ligase II